jgi:hypothetical protein
MPASQCRKNPASFSGENVAVPAYAQLERRARRRTLCVPIPNHNAVWIDEETTCRIGQSDAVTSLEYF